MNAVIEEIRHRWAEEIEVYSADPAGAVMYVRGRRYAFIYVTEKVARRYKKAKLGSVWCKEQPPYQEQFLPPSQWKMLVSKAFEAIREAQRDSRNSTQIGQQLGLI